MHTRDEINYLYELLNLKKRNHFFSCVDKLNKNMNKHKIIRDRESPVWLLKKVLTN
jgi:hypothetical protein